MIIKAQPQSTSRVFVFFSFFWRQNSLSSPSLICNLQSSCLCLLSIMIPRVLYHGWLSNRTSCNNDKVKNIETVSFDTPLKTVSKAFRLKWLGIGRLYFLGSEVLNYRSVHSGLSPTAPGFGVLEVSLWALMGIYELVAIFQESKMEKHAQIKPDFQYLCFGTLEFYQLRRAAQAVPGLAALRCPW